MKKLVVGAVIALGCSVNVAQAGNSAGCGLGSNLFDGQKGLVSNVFAATTNGISGNQTFGMSSGTLGCNADDTVMAAASFVSDNMVAVSLDISRGSGAHLDSLAELMGVGAQDSQVFAAMAKNHFASIVSSTQVTALQLVNNINALMKENIKLSKYAV